MFQLRGVSAVFCWTAMAAFTLAAQSSDGPPVVVPHRATPNRPAQKPTVARQAELLVSCDMACTFTFDGESKGHMDADGSVKIKSSAGRHLVVATADVSAERMVKPVNLLLDQQVLLQVELKTAHEARLQSERAEQQRQQEAAANQARQQEQQRQEQARKAQEEERKRQAQAQAEALYQKGSVLPRGPEERSYYQQACEKGSAKGCDRLGDIYQFGLGVAKNLEQAGHFYGIGCEQDLAEACNAAGSVKRELRDEAGANAAYAHERILDPPACDRNDKYACDRMGDLLSDGDGGAKDVAAAVALYEKACNLDEAAGCADLGLLYARGSDVSVDAFRAVQYLEKACNLADRWCDDLADLYAEGRLVPMDRQKAHLLYQKTCKAGFTFACDK